MRQYRYTEMNAQKHMRRRCEKDYLLNLGYKKDYKSEKQDTEPCQAINRSRIPDGLNTCNHNVLGDNIFTGHQSCTNHLVYKSREPEGQH